MRFDYVYGEEIGKFFPDIQMSLELITPEIAKKMLETNVENRSFKREPLNRALKKGEWAVNGASIVFSNDGILRDGQNRLKAVVDTGICIISVVIRGIEPTAQQTMDSGVKRQICDFLKMRGYKEAEKVSAIGCALLRADTMGLDSYFDKPSNNKFTAPEYLRFIEENYEERIKPIVRPTVELARSFKCLTTASVGVLSDKFREIDEDCFEDFYKQIRGVRKQCQPVQMLVRKLNEIDKKSKKETTTKGTIVVYLIKTWNAYMQGDELSFLRYTRGGSAPESFPAIYEP